MYWRLKVPRSSKDNAPTLLRLGVRADTGLKVEFRRAEEENLPLLEERWLTKGEVEEEEKAEMVLGRGTPEPITVAVCIRGPSENLLYREASTLEAGKIKLSGFFLSEAWEENYTHRIRPKGEVEGDLPVFVGRIEVSVDGEKVDSDTSRRGYVPRNPFPRALLRSEIEEGFHTIRLTLFNERGEKVASVENRRIVG